MEADSEYNLFSGPKTLQETLRDEYVEVQPQSNWAAQVNRFSSIPNRESEMRFLFSQQAPGEVRFNFPISTTTFTGSEFYLDMMLQIVDEADGKSPLAAGESKSHVKSISVSE